MTNRLLKYPNVGDDRMMSLIQGLRKVFQIHRSLLNKGVDAPPYFPEEIIEQINVPSMEKAWEVQNYDYIFRVYVEAWLKYVKDIIGKDTFYDLEEYLDGTAEKDYDNS